MTWMVGFFVINYPVLCHALTLYWISTCPELRFVHASPQMGRDFLFPVITVQSISNSSGSGASTRQLGNQLLLILSPAFLPCISAFLPKFLPLFSLKDALVQRDSPHLHKCEAIEVLLSYAFAQCIISLHPLLLITCNPPTIPGLYSVVTSLVTINLPQPSYSLHPFQHMRIAVYEALC